MRLGHLCALADRRSRRRLLRGARRTAIGPFEVRDARRAAAGAGSHGAIPPLTRARAEDSLPLRALRRNRLCSREGHPPARRRAERAAQRRGRHLRRRAPRPPRGDPRLRQRAHVRSAPGRRWSRPQHTPKLLTTLERKAELIASLGVEELIVIPSTPTSPSAQRRGVHRRRARRRARRHAGLDRRELPLRPQGPGRPAPARSRRALRDRRAPAAGGRRGDRLLQPHPRAGAGAARWHEADRASRRRRFSCAARSCTATSAGASSAFRPPTSSPRRRSRAPATASTPASPTGAPAAVSIGVRPTFKTGQGRADRGLHPRLRRRPLRQRAAPRVPRAPARRAALRHARGAGRADAPRRRAHARDRPARLLRRRRVANRRPL